MKKYVEKLNQENRTLQTLFGKSLQSDIINQE